MRILALETSARAVSAAVTEDGKVLCSGYQDTGLTHSRTLMPIVEAMLKNTGLTVRDCDAVAVAAGPGSFTGIRIGVSAAKGLAFAADKPCAAVSTLEAMARNVSHMDALVVCAMDARRSQIYNALFTAEQGRLTRRTPDRAIGLAELAEELRDEPLPLVLVGDGAALCERALREAGLRGCRCELVPAFCGKTEQERRGSVDNLLKKAEAFSFPAIRLFIHPVIQSAALKAKNSANRIQCSPKI